ncbi:MAG TPA: CvpA family protein [Sphingobacteriaceae bacterium]
MNLVDLIVISIVILAAYQGWQKGFIFGSLELISWVGTLVLAVWLYPLALSFLDILLRLPGIWSFTISFLVTLVFVRLITAALLNPAFKAIPDDAHQSKVNTALGVVPGAINGIIYAALAVTVFLLMPLSQTLTRKTQESPLANMLSKQVERLEATLAPTLGEAIKRSTNNLTVEPSSDKTVELHFTVKDPTPRPDLEVKMLEMLNKERRKRGVAPLKHDPQLVPVARAHCDDMFGRGYFSHISPEGKTPSDRIREANVVFITAGENLALAQTLTIAHTGLMNSPGHKANILRPAFGRVGIGILDGGIYGIMVTQNFRN